MISKGRYFALALLMTAFLSTATANVIKFIDIDGPNGILSDIQEEFEKAREAISKEFQSTVERLGQKKQDLEAKKNDVKDKQAHQAKIDDCDKEIQAKAQASQAKMMAEQQKAQQKAEERMKKIEAIRAKNGWHAVMPSGSTIAHNKAHNVTDVVKKELGTSCPPTKSRK